MRRLLLLAILVLSIETLPIAVPTVAAAAEECTGDNCPPPQSGRPGGHDCEHEKKEQTVS